jgi:hypothetical protein
MEPSYAPADFPMLFSAVRNYWIEAEACLPDGRRVFAAKNITATSDASNLAAALDTADPVSTAEPPWGWFAQTSQTHDGIDAAQSGDIPRGKRSRMDMTVRGPGTIQFWWKTTSSDRDDKLRFLVDGLSKRSLSGTKDWRMVSYSLSPGEHTLGWEYRRSVGSSAKRARGWVDQLSFTSAATSASSLGPTAQITMRDGQIVLRWVTVSQTSYRVLFKQSLSDPDWQELDRPISINDRMATVVDPVDGSPQRFYRIAVNIP